MVGKKRELECTLLIGTKRAHKGKKGTKKPKNVLLYLDEHSAKEVSMARLFTKSKCEPAVCQKSKQIVLLEIRNVVLTI